MIHKKVATVTVEFEVTWLDEDRDGKEWSPDQELIDFARDRVVNEYLTNEARKFRPKIIITFNEYFDSGLSTRTDLIYLPIITRQPVPSSNLASVGYDEESNILEVEFSSGTVYRYSGVPPYVYDDLTSGKFSVGQYFQKAVKDAGYKYERLK